MTPTPPSLSSFAGWGLEGGAFFYKSDAARPGTRSTQVSPVRAIPAQRPPTTLPPPSNFSFKLRERARGGRGGSPQAKAATTTPSSLPHSLSPHHTHTRIWPKQIQGTVRYTGVRGDGPRQGGGGAAGAAPARPLSLTQTRPQRPQRTTPTPTTTRPPPRTPSRHRPSRRCSSRCSSRHP